MLNKHLVNQIPNSETKTNSNVFNSDKVDFKSRVTPGSFFFSNL